MNQKKIFFKLIVSFFVFLSLFGVFLLQSLEERGKLVVNFFDVGQGDAVFIKTPSNQKILIDGGPDNTILEKLGKNLPFYDKQIDLIILTHPHSDHLVGLIEVLRRYEVKKIVSTGVLHTTPDFLVWQEEIRDQGIAFKVAIAGQVLDFEDGVRIEILHPIEDLRGQSVEDLNDTSIVCKLIYGNTSFLFMGDAEASAEERLITSEIDLKSDVLKIGHHGSKYATSEEFLDKVSPQSAVILVGGENRFGHPSLRVTRRLERKEIEILRTDRGGDIKFLSDGVDIIRK